MNSNWSYSPETPNLGQIRRVLETRDLEIWRMTLKNNRAPLLSIIKPYAWFHQHLWIQTGVTVRKRLSWVVTSVTLNIALWPWPFAWISLLSLVISPENFVMIRWWEHTGNNTNVRHSDMADKMSPKSEKLPNLPDKMSEECYGMKILIFHHQLLVFCLNKTMQTTFHYGRKWRLLTVMVW